ncbi:blastoderm-specific protein 25D isoform X2 [Malaya genurostris]|uniref:blastoderm-specific protein 25D isoform X2 n=1 Tax=Malaya genurostris TaxID=325434 RepID=UPI0026F38973|nr:blastoderm-specific protein 25D isoform X2 [Malaya genurostris]
MIIIFYSADDQNVSTSSPTAVSASTAFSSNNSSSSSTSAGSIISNTSKHHHHPHLTYQRQAAADRDAQQRTESESVGRAATNKISSIVPSCCEEDLITTTTTTTSPTNPITTTSDNENESSDREVSPKFIVGTKKYGRRSRPREDCNGLDTSSDLSNSDNESVSPSQQKDPNGSSKTSSKVQRSASQSDIHGSKRRRPMSGARLKRCVSLPTHRQRPDVAQSKLNAKNVREQLNMDEKIDKKIYFLKLSENLRDIWDSLVGDGHGALLNQSQLEIVCERVGLQKLPAKLAAKEVFSKLCLQPIEGISFNEFISLLQSDSDILPIGDGGMDGVTNKAVSDNACVAAARLFDESDSFKAQELDRDSVEETVGFSVQMPDWTAEIGSLSSAIIVDMWESAGVVDAKNLLQDLGFYDEEIQVTNLVTALEDELQRLGDSNETYVIVKASLALHKAEVAALRQAFVQLVEENKKLYADNKEVNQRALLIAQEVDERTNSLEASTRNKIRLLEQRHNEAIRELSSQLAHEREQLSSTSSNMEKRIRTLETEEARQKGEIWRLSGDNEILRIEQENLTKELTELLEKNIKLNKDIAELEENNRNDFDDGFDRKDDLEVLELIEKISLLQNENTDLRDKNDEFSAEIESLNVELAKFKLKRSSVNRTSSLEMSPVVVETTGGTEENASAARKRQGDSPSKARLSDESPRLGKFRKCSNDLENESDSSGDWMALQSELGIKVDSAIASSGISQDFSSNNESSCNDAEIRQLKTKIAELEKKLEERGLGSSSEKTENEIKGAPTTDSDLSEHDKMKARCDELEASLEQMSKEYEACEDYWQNKVNEERQLFEEEQRISDDKFNELLKKMAEYEEQFAGQGTSKVDDGRLSPIEEKDILEQQYLDLELELQQTQLVLEEKSHEVDKLRNRIAEFEQLTKYSSETMLATPPRVDTPEIDSPASSPISYLMKQSTIQAPARDYQNPNWCQPLSNGGPVDSINGPNASRSPTSHSIAAVEVDEQAIDEDSGFNRTISPIHKPIIAASSATDVTSCGGDHRDMGDCPDVCSVKSARSTHSLASTHSIHKSVSQNDVTMVSQEQLKQLRLMQLQLQDEIKELTQQRDCLKMEFQQLCEAKPILARAYTKTNHPNQTQKIQHLEQKIRQQQSMLKQQQIYTENILHQIWQQQRSEISNLRDRLEAQSVVISEQANRLASNDVLVKDLYMENSNLLVQVQRLEQQKARAQLLQQFSQATANAHHQASHHQSQLSGIVPGLP